MTPALGPPWLSGGLNPARRRRRRTPSGESFVAADFVHAELAHLAVQVRAMHPQETGRLAHVPLHALDRSADELLLKLATGHLQRHVTRGLERHLAARVENERQILGFDLVSA